MTYIVSDIHGRADRFRSVLEKICFSEKDTMYILGDVIDRNPDGIQILQELMHADHMFMILGNHEHMMLNVVQTPAEEKNEAWMEALGLWYLNGGEVTFQSFQGLAREEQNSMIDYLKALPLNREICIEGKSYLLIHGSPEADYRPDNPDFPDVTTYAVWNRFDPFAKNNYAGKTVICGHTPTIFFCHRTPMEVFKAGNTICMDCGCAFPDGRLACLCLETGEIIYSSDKVRLWRMRK